jgi:hypothetical protein
MKLGLVFLFILLSCTQVGAQKSTDLSDLETRLVALVQDKLPDWTHETVEPMQGSTDVAIHRWTSGKTVIRLTIIRNESIGHAKRAIREFAIHMSAGGEPPDAGEEQYACLILVRSFFGSVILQSILMRTRLMRKTRRNSLSNSRVI